MIKFRKAVNIKLRDKEEEGIPVLMGLSENSVLLSVHKLKIPKER